MFGVARAFGGPGEAPESRDRVMAARIAERHVGSDP
jgi:hypothetical protein